MTDVCPRCNANSKAFLDKEWAELEADYGKVRSYEWARQHELLEERRQIIERREDRTFQADYTIELVDNEVRVWYRGNCTRCQLRIEFMYNYPWKAGLD